MSDPRLAEITDHPLWLPMRQPFVTARGHKTVTRNRLLTIRLTDGSAGAGEASESLAWPNDSPARMRRCVTALRPRLVGQTLPGAWRQLRDAWCQPWASPAALSAFECALASAEARVGGIPLWRYFAHRLGQRRAHPRVVHTSLTISAWPATVAARAARRAAAQQFRLLKVKVTGRDPDADLMRLVAVHHAAPASRLIVDANQGFSAPQALFFARVMRRFRLPVVAFEQPVRYDDLEGMAMLTREAGTPIVADESVRTPHDARRIIARHAAHILNLKLAKSGLLGTLEMMRQAQRRRVRLMIGCMAESARGLGPSVHLACGSGAFHYVDLDSHLLVKNPPGAVGFLARGPTLSVSPQ